MKLAWLFAISSVILTGCYNVQTWVQDQVYVFNGNLRAATKNLDHELERKRLKLQFEGGKVATNCTSYYANATRYSLLKTGTSLEHKSAYLACDALKLLPANAQPVSLPVRPLSISGRNLAQSLDLRSFPSSFQLASSEQKPTLHALFPKDIDYKGTKAILDLGDWVFSLEIAAAVDINANDQLDWIVWAREESKKGSYRGYQTLIVYDPAGQKLYDGHTFPKVKR